MFWSDRGPVCLHDYWFWLVGRLFALLYHHLHRWVNVVSVSIRWVSTYRTGRMSWVTSTRLSPLQKSQRWVQLLLRRFMCQKDEIGLLPPIAMATELLTAQLMFCLFLFCSKEESETTRTRPSSPSWSVLQVLVQSLNGTLRHSDKTTHQSGAWTASVGLSTSFRKVEV